VNLYLNALSAIKLLKTIGLWYSTVNFHSENYRDVACSAHEPACEAIKNMQIGLKSVLRRWRNDRNSGSMAEYA